MLFKKGKNKKNKKETKVDVNLDTLDMQAKKKKTFLIVGIFIILMGVLFISVASTILTLQKKKVYKKRVENKIPKEIEVIQNSEMKEGWAISVENRLEEQGKSIKEIKKNLKNNKQDIINALREELKKNNEVINKKMDTLSKTVAVQMKNNNEKIKKEIESLKEENKLIKMKLKSLESLKNLKIQKNNEEDIVISKNLLPNIPKPPVKSGGTNIKGSELTIVVPLPNKEISKKEEKNIKKEQKPKKEEEIAKLEKQLPIENNAGIKNESKGKEIKSKPKIINHKKNIKIVSIDTSFNGDIINTQNQIQAENKRIKEQMEIQEEIKNGFHVSIGFTQAYMITGAYAPTFQNSQTSPLPVLLEAQGNILMANDTQGSIDKCFLLGSAKGNINSQTVSIKLVAISCLVDDGKYRIEGPISGWVIGENGMPGLPGEMIHKNGAWVAKTFIAGFLQTFSQAFTGTPQQIVLGTGTTSQNQNVGNALVNNTGYAAATGLGNVFGKLGDYYLKMAEQIFPVIEVKPGRTVDIMLLGGENLKVVKNNPISISRILKYIEQEENKKERKKQQILNNQTLSTNPFTRTISGGLNGGNINSDGTTTVKSPNGIDVKIPLEK
jgi:hypothetical protein